MKLVITVAETFAPMRSHQWGAMFGEPDVDNPYRAFGATKEDAVRDLLDNYDWPEGA